MENNYKCLDQEIGVCPFNSKNKWMARVFKPVSYNNEIECFGLSDDECVIAMKGNKIKYKISFIF